MLLLFLPRPSLLFEVYPYKYFKQAYSPLSREYGVLHGNVMSPPVSRLNALLLHGECAVGGHKAGRCGVMCSSVM
jgi:hypothetical protein